MDDTTTAISMPLSYSVPEFESTRKRAILPNPILDWRRSPRNDWSYWNTLAEKANKKGDPAETAYRAIAYITDDGFLHFCQDICGFKEMDEQFHGPICDFVIGSLKYEWATETNGVVRIRHDHIDRSIRKDLTLAQHTRQRVLEAFRSSFKSCITSQAFPTWVIAREYLLTGAVNIQIGLQSEILGHAADHVSLCRQIMESPDYEKHFGVNAPTARTKGSKWGGDSATSALRTRILKSPTIWTIALGAERTGYHFDIIVHDDLQARRSAYTRDQLENTWELYRLNESLLNKPGVSWYAEEVGACTRWAESDVYGRIEKENTAMAKGQRTVILKMPIHRNGRPTFSARFPKEEIERLRIKQGPAVFASQYELEPIAGEDKPFKLHYIQYYSPPEIQHKLPTMYAVTGVDFAWTEVRRRGSEQADHSVVLTFLVDEDWRFYLLDAWRKQCIRKETIAEAYRQAMQHKSVAVGFDEYDRKHTEDEITSYPFENKCDPINPVWVKRSAREIDKKTHILTTLQGLFAARRIYLYRGEGWLESEILDFVIREQSGGTDDGLDAMCCAVKSANAPAFGRKSAAPRVDPWARMDKSLATGRPVNLAGKPIKLSSSHSAQRRFRRARSQTTE